MLRQNPSDSYLIATITRTSSKTDSSRFSPRRSRLFPVEFRLIQWHDIWVDCFRCSTSLQSQMGKSIFHASGMTPHDPKREWLIGNFSSDCADLARTRFLFSFRCCRTLVASEAIETGLSRDCADFACIIKIFISRRQSDLWLEIFVGPGKQLEKASRALIDRNTFLNLSLAPELRL